MTQKTSEPSPEENILELEFKNQLSDRCNKLKTPYREIAMDYFYNNLSANEIAKNTGKNLKTVQTQIYRARALLQKVYRKEAIKNDG